MQVAIDADNLGALEDDGDGPTLGLRPVEHRVVLADAVEIVEQAVAVE
jgi:hypothetical protein